MESLVSVPDALLPVSKLLEQNNPTLLVVVGAGVSIGATEADQASWQGLLHHGIDHLVAKSVLTAQYGWDLRKSLDDAFSPFDLAQVLGLAESIELNLKIVKDQSYADWLAAAFQNLNAKSENRQTLDAILDLQRAGALILTTNYDSVLCDHLALPAVTWEDFNAFLRVTNRQQTGVLHVHGHWKSPSSVILGKTSYDKITRDQEFQEVFKHLWMGYSWLYVGCGEGLGDPNLGRLLEWGKAFKDGKAPDYFLAPADKVASLKDQSNTPGNLVGVGISSHDELPAILRSLTPTSNPYPFVPIDKNFYQFRREDSDAAIAFPSQQEYVGGDVPALQADEVVCDRLERFKWASVLDVASVGKTTLALRIATSPAYRRHLSFYLDFSTVDAEIDGPEITAAFRRLTRPDSLLILENVHHNPELCRQLWDAWRARPRGSRLLLTATLIQRSVLTTAAQDLTFFSQHDENPSVELRPKPEDLEQILRCIVRRVAGPSNLIPPADVLQKWHKDYGSALGAYCFAVLGHLGEFGRGNWDLPPEAASDWVREKWLKGLKEPELENLLCLAAFGIQELEIQVPDDALPHPGKIKPLLDRGLVNRSKVGKFRQFTRFNLPEPGWGDLILAANPENIRPDDLLFEAAARNPMVALVLNSRFSNANMAELKVSLWAHLAENSNEVVPRAAQMPLSYFWHFVEQSSSVGQADLAKRSWAELGKYPEKLAKRAWETPLGYLASFLETAKGHERIVHALWAELEKNPEKLAERARETRLGDLGSFFETAKGHERIVHALWAELEKNPEKLAERAWETPLDQLASFLETAKGHRSIVDVLWDELEKYPEKLAKRAWETQLHFLASFLETAKGHKSIVDVLWDELEKYPEKLAERAWETRLGDLGSFFETAKGHERIVHALWAELEKNPEKLAERARETPLGQLGSFLDTAKGHKSIVDVLWDELEKNPEKLAKRAWETPLDHLGSFLETAKAHERDFCALIEILQREPKRLSQKVRDSSVDNLAGFCNHVPDSLVQSAFAYIDAQEWTSLPESRPMIGATWVAYKCEQIGREDLETAIVTLLLRRAKPADFPVQVNSLGSAAWMLSRVPPTENNLVPTFLKNVCKPRWLELQYMQLEAGRLAGGLRLLGLNQPHAILRHFRHKALSIKLANEFSKFPQASADQQSQILQLLGCARLCGVFVRPDWFRFFPFNHLSKLPLETLPHAVDASSVDLWQFQLWLGLRTATFVTKTRLQLKSSVIEETLGLWRVNLAESEESGALIERRVNLEMVRWLERCAQDGQGCLLPAPWPRLP